MGILATILQVLLLLVSLFLVIVILLQRGRGGGLAGAFGGMGGQSAFGTKAGDVFTRITVVIAIIWVLLAGGSGVAMRMSADSFARDAFESRSTDDDGGTESIVPDATPGTSASDVFPPASDANGELFPPASSEDADSPASEDAAPSTTDEPADDTKPETSDESTEEESSSEEEADSPASEDAASDDGSTDEAN